MDKDIIEVNTSPKEITLAHEPRKVLSEAKQACTALMEVVSQKKKPVIMNGEQYLEFEDWQTVAKFYGITARVTKTELIKIDNVIGYEAYAEAVDKTGLVVSAANSMCLNDEDKWSKRAKYDYIKGQRVKVGEVAVPLFQLRSMAQTRACAKALRNVLAWVVVLAGFRPTPAEEMTMTEVPPPQVQVQTPPPSPKPAPVVKEPTAESIAWGEETIDMSEPNLTAPHGAQSVPSNEPTISEPQRKRLYAIAMGAGMSRDRFKSWLFEYGYEHSKDIKKSDYENICAAAESYNPIGESK